MPVKTQPVADPKRSVATSPAGPRSSSESRSKPIEAIRILKGRIISSHLKDLNEFGVRDAHDVPYGQGQSGLKEVLDELKAQGFRGNISIEYEYHWDNSVPEVTQCIDFVKAYQP